jgi:hypothetical protein
MIQSVFPPLAEKTPKDASQGIKQSPRETDAYINENIAAARIQISVCGIWNKQEPYRSVKYNGTPSIEFLF